MCLSFFFSFLKALLCPSIVVSLFCFTMKTMYRIVWLWNVFTATHIVVVVLWRQESVPGAAGKWRWLGAFVSRHSSLPSRSPTHAPHPPHARLACWSGRQDSGIIRAYAKTVAKNPFKNLRILWWWWQTSNINDLLLHIVLCWLSRLTCLIQYCHAPKKSIRQIHNIIDLLQYLYQSKVVTWQQNRKIIY